MNARAMVKPAALTAILLAVLLSLAGCAKPVPSLADAPLAGAAIGGPFALVDKAGHTVRDRDFAGKYRIVYFGYTFCPDACPTDMNVESRAIKILGRAHPGSADRLRALFITIDPARDTPAVVGQFAAAFPPLIGLTGSPAEIARTAREYGAYYARGKNTAGGYLMDHSRAAYLMGPDGQPIALLPLDQGPQATAEVLAQWVR